VGRDQCGRMDDIYVGLDGVILEGLGHFFLVINTSIWNT